MHTRLARKHVALAPVARRARSHDVLPTGCPALRAWNHGVDSDIRARPAVLAHPTVSREHGATCDLAAVGVARNVHVAHESDHHGSRERGTLGMKLPQATLDQLGLLLEQEHYCASYRAHVDRLEGGVEDEHPTTHRRTRR